MRDESMSERTFRTVVAAVLVGALLLAVAVAGAVVLRQSPGASASASVPTYASFAPSRTPAPTGAPAPTGTPGPVFTVPRVTGVGRIPRGGSTGPTLVLQFLELRPDAIPNAAGSFRVTLTDNAGHGTTVAFTGTPAVVGPDSLGATARLINANVLQVSITGSDPYHVELMTIRGLGISAASSAVLGPVHAELGDCTGSLARGAATNVLASPGTVVAIP